MSTGWVNSSSPFLSVTRVQILKNEEFKAKVNLFKTSAFLAPAPVPFLVEPPQPMYVDISEQYELFKFVVEDCFVAPSAKPNTVLSTFFLDRCLSKNVGK